MAINDIVQTIAEARVDARSLSEFVFKPAGFKVTRRLAPTVDTLQFYINRFNSLNGDFSSSVSVALSSLNNSVSEAEGKVAYIETTVQDAINDTVISSGFITIDSFELGATLTQRNQALRHTADGKLYRWAGDLPKTVIADSTPTSSGGMGDNAWLEVSDVTLRQDLANPDKGAAMVARGVMAVGSIADLLALPTGQRKADMLYSVKEYHAGTGVGGGEFYWDVTSTESENGATIFGSSEGRWKLKPTSLVTPRSFGIHSGMESGEQSDLLQLFFDLSVELQDAGYVLSPAGRYEVNRPIVLNIPGVKYADGVLALVVNPSDAFDGDVLDGVNTRGSRFDSIEINAGSTNQAARRATHGLTIRDGRGMAVENLRVVGVRGFGLRVLSGGTGNNSNFLDLGSLNFGDCGRYSSAAEFPYEEVSRSGSSSNSNQRSQIRLSGVDTLFDNDQTCVFIGNKPYVTTGQTSEPGVYDVYPWIDEEGGSGTARVFVGGGAIFAGSDTGIANVARVNAIRCGTAWVARNSYGGSISLTAQFCGVAYQAGNAPNSLAAYGETLHNLYAESTDVDVFITSRAATAHIIDPRAVSVDRCHYIDTTNFGHAGRIVFSGRAGFNSGTAFYREKVSTSRTVWPDISVSSTVNYGDVFCADNVSRVYPIDLSSKTFNRLTHGEHAVSIAVLYFKTTDTIRLDLPEGHTLVGHESQGSSPELTGLPEKFNLYVGRQNASSWRMGIQEISGGSEYVVESAGPQDQPLLSSMDSGST